MPSIEACASERGADHMFGMFRSVEQRDAGLYGKEVKVDVVARGEDDLSGASNLETYP